MVCIISSGILKRLPSREKNAFFMGFQNPRTPSYFSKSHLRRKQSLDNQNFRFELGGGGEGDGNQPIGGIDICFCNKACGGWLTYIFDIFGALVEVVGWHGIGDRLCCVEVECCC